MKIIAFLLLIFCMHVSAITLAQNVSLSEHNASLEKVINEIKQQTGYSFFYNQDWLQQSHPVDIDVKEVSLEKALQLCFLDQPYDYAIVNHTIVLKLKRSSLAKNSGEAPVFNINGKVTDSLGTSLIGATVTIKGSKKSTITDENGDFTISVQQGDVILISYIGYRQAEILIGNGMPYLNITLQRSVAELKEVVVNTGYQNIPAERATGSFAQVDNQLFNRKTSPDVLSRLDGIVPGLLVTKNLNPSSLNNNPNGIDISIHGYNTLFSNSQPLLVVDNFPYNGNIQEINPNDVENITILKDAAAASIWGAQSGNGVIVITTKKGRRDQPLRVGFNSNITIGDKPNIFYSPNFLDSKDFISVEESLFNQGFYDGVLTNTREYPVVSPVVQILANERAGILSASDANSQINALQSIDTRNDISKYFYRKSVEQQYNFNFSGGGKGNDYYYSVGYDNFDSSLIGNQNDRLTIDVKNNFYPFKGLQLSSELNYIQSNIQSNSQAGNLNVGGTYNNIYPYAQLADSHGNPLPIVRDYNYQWITDPTAQAGLLDWQFRPLQDQRLADNTSKDYDFRVVSGLKYSFPFGLSANIMHQYERLDKSQQNYYSQDMYYTRNLINSFTNLTGTPEYPIPVGGILQSGDNVTTSNDLRGLLNFNKVFNQNNEVSAIVGTEISQKRQDLLGSSATVYGYDKNTGSSQPVDFVDSFVQNPNKLRGHIPGSNGGGTVYLNRFVSYFGNASYNYSGKYTLSASARVDASNLFGVNTNQKAVPLYSVGAKWDINKEKFYQSDWLPVLKLRTTYGYNGNINYNSTALTTLTYVSTSTYSSLPYAYVNGAGNPDLRWEKDQFINFGLDWASKNNFITGTIDYYIKKGMDLYGEKILPPSTGVSHYFANAANTSGRGLEITVTASPIHTQQFSWTSTLMFNHNTDKVTKYDLPQTPGQAIASTADGNSISPIAGNPVFGIYAYKSGGLTHNTGDPQGYLNGQLSTNYSGILQNTGIDSLKLFGSARPINYGSWMNTFKYKSFSLSANIIYKFNYYFRRSSIQYNSLYNTWVGNTDFDKRWQAPGDEAHTIIPSMPTVANSSTLRDEFYENSEALVDKGDNIRLQDIILSYDFRKPRLFANTFNYITIYGNINNVGILWRANKDHLDPDVFPGNGGFYYPAPRTVSFGIKAGF